MNVGLAIKAAIARCELHEVTCTRKLRVRLTTQPGDGNDALIIRATIAARTDEEIQRQEKIGLRRIPWAEFDARADELVSMVDEAVAEVETAFGLRREFAHE